MLNNNSQPQNDSQIVSSIIVNIESDVPDLTLHSVRIVDAGKQLNSAYYVTEASILYRNTHETLFNALIEPASSVDYIRKLNYNDFRSS